MRDEMRVKVRDEEAWTNSKTHYVRAVELTDRVHYVEGHPLNLRNPWDPADMFDDHEGE